MKPCVLLGFVSYGPYHLARLEACHELLPELDVLGWELSTDQSEYGWHHAGDRHVTSVTSEPLEKVGVFQWLQRVWKHLNSLDPAVCVLAGYAHPGMLAALLWCRVKGRGVVIMSDSKEDDAPRRALMEWCKGRLLGLYDAALVAGLPHREYFVRLGFPARRIHSGYDVVDNAAYGAKHQPLPPVGGPYFLTVSRFVTKKNLPTLLAAYAGYVEHMGGEQAWDLVICGDGPLKAELEWQITDLRLNGRVHLPGFLQMEEMLPYLGHARALVHASVQEQWGLVVNEAMAAGLPVIVSRVCGCFQDLVKESVNGFGFDPLNADDLTRLLVRLHRMPESERQAMGESGRGWIQESHSTAHFARSLEACVKLALARHRRTVSS